MTAVFDTADEYQAAFSLVGNAPTLSGTVDLICARLGDGRHRVLDECHLDVVAGLADDRWRVESDPMRDQQLTLMQSNVVKVLLGSKSLLPVPGDNFLVDFDLSETNAPVGTQLRLGESIVEITRKPHTGCRKFSERFGVSSLEWISQRELKTRRLRGVHARVVTPGAVRHGDVIARLA